MPARPKPSNVAALEQTLKAMSDFLSPADAASVQAARTLAAAVDGAPTHASLWREYREALGVLRGLIVAETHDEFADLLAALRDTPTG
jgi:hypothetical protein